MRGLDRNQCFGLAVLVSSAIFTLLAWGVLVGLARLAGAAQ